MSTDQPFRLSESFATFADPTEDDWRHCGSCGEPVQVRYLEGGECVGCRYGGDR